MEADLTPVYVTVPVVLLFVLIISVRLYLQSKWGWCKSRDSLKGKTFLITGANSGIGFETAAALTKRGGRVIFACRNMDTANEAISQIRKSNKKPLGEMIAMPVDLSSLESVRKFVETVKIGFDKIDVLINNAGVAVPTVLGEKTMDGLEINFGVNHVAPFLLTSLLLDRLEAAAPSRVVIVSSQLYKDGKIDLDDLNSERRLEEIKKSPRSREDPAYANSKLMNIYFGGGLAERTRGRGIDVFVLCPGFTYTNLFRHNLRWYHFVFLTPIFFFLMRTPRQGAQTSLYCTTEPSLKGKSGKFYANCKEATLAMDYDKEVEDKLWAATEGHITSNMA